MSPKRRGKKGLKKKLLEGIIYKKFPNFVKDINLKNTKFIKHQGREIQRQKISRYTQVKEKSYRGHLESHKTGKIPLYTFKQQYEI